MTRELYFYNLFYQKMFRGDDTKTYQLFAVPIGNEKITYEINFNPSESVIKYHQKASNSCCLSSLASDFHSIDDNRDVTDLVNRIE